MNMRNPSISEGSRIAAMDPARLYEAKEMVHVLTVSFKQKSTKRRRNIKWLRMYFRQGFGIFAIAAKFGMSGTRVEQVCKGFQRHALERARKLERKI